MCGKKPVIESTLFCSDCGTELSIPGQGTDNRQVFTPPESERDGAGTGVGSRPLSPTQTGSIPYVRPAGIVVVCIYMALSGISSLVASIMLSGVAEIIGMELPAFLSVIMVVLAVACLAATYGLWMGQGWGYNLTLVLMAISIFASILLLLLFSIPKGARQTDYLYQVLSIVISLGIVMYLRSETARAFLNPYMAIEMSFKCPKCGLALFSDEATCPNCYERTHEIIYCSECGLALFAENEPCPQCSGG